MLTPDGIKDISLRKNGHERKKGLLSDFQFHYQRSTNDSDENQHDFVKEKTIEEFYANESEEVEPTTTTITEQEVNAYSSVVHSPVVHSPAAYLPAAYSSAVNSSVVHSPAAYSSAVNSSVVHSSVVHSPSLEINNRTISILPYFEASFNAVLLNNRDKFHKL